MLEKIDELLTMYRQKANQPASRRVIARSRHD